MDATEIVRLVENHILNRGDNPVPVTAPKLTWQTLALAANWTPLGGAFPTPAFAKAENGLVYLAGIANYTGAAGGANTTIGNLPPGYWPAQQIVVPVIAVNSFARVDVTTGGAVILSLTPGATSTWVALHSIIFPT